MAIGSTVVGVVHVAVAPIVMAFSVGWTKVVLAGASPEPARSTPLVVGWP